MIGLKVEITFQNPIFGKKELLKLFSCKKPNILVQNNSEHRLDLVTLKRSTVDIGFGKKSIFDYNSFKQTIRCNECFY